MSAKDSILIVDDEQGVLDLFGETLAREDRIISTYLNPVAALRESENRRVDVVLSDLYMPEMDGVELLKQFKTRDPETEVVLLTAYGDIERAVEAMKCGAADFFIKPVRVDELAMSVAKLLEFRSMRRRLKELSGGNLAPVGAGVASKRIMELAKTVAETDATVLIRGETGVGKEVLADYVQTHSARADGPFIKVNCAALPESLLESELFGHEKGAFTGASERRIGRFERAHKGTLFLDEIGEMPLFMQSKLLRVLETKEIERIGGAQSIAVDFRLICATHRDLGKMIEQKLFREDLYYRINVFPITIPPLRERREDLPALILHFLKRSRLKLGRGPTDLAPDALQFLCRQAWPGNVRELENAIERLCLLTKGPVLTSAVLALGAITDDSTDKNQDVSAPLAADPAKSVAASAETESAPIPTTEENSAMNPAESAAEENVVLPEPTPAPTDVQPVPEKKPSATPEKNSSPLPWEADIENPLEVAERLTLKAVLDRCDWNFVRAAEVLKISRSTLYSKAARYDLRKSEDAADASAEI